MDEILDRNKLQHLPEQENEDNPLGDIDFTKILSIVNKSLIWIILFIIVSVSTAWLVIRYTPPLYESSSILKLKVTSDANMLGLGGMGENIENHYGNLTGEIELIKSKLFYSKVMEQMDLGVSYFTKGDILSTEIYKTAPFSVEYNIKNDAFYNQPIEVVFNGNGKFFLKYVLRGEEVFDEFEVGREYENDFIRFRIDYTKNYSPDIEGRPYTFVINSTGALHSYFSNNMKVEVVNLNASTIKISFTDHHKAKAQDIVNTINQVYLTLTLENKNKATEQTLKFLDDQLEYTSAKLEKSEVNFENFVLDAKTVNVKTEIGKTVEQVEAQIRQKLDLDIQMSLLEDLKRLILTQESIEQFIPSLRMIEDPQLNTIIQALNNANAEREKMLISTKANTQAYRSASSHVDKLRTGTLELIEENKKLLLTKRKNIDESIRKLENSFLTLPGKDTKLTRIRRVYDLDEKFYLMLMDKKVQFGIAKAGIVPEFQILAPASLPGAPISPKKGMIYGIGFGVGLMLGIGLVAGRYFLHNTFTSQKELERATVAPVLGVVPKYTREKLETARLVVDKNPKASVSESLRSIRTNLEFLSTSADQKKIITVTSTVGGEGKTFIAVNMAGILALTGKKVVLLDLDMRKPKVNMAFDKDNIKGMSTLLIGKHSLEECIHLTSIETLHVICAGPMPPNPSELMLRPAMDELLKELHTQYDIIVIDSPPVGLVTDGIILMRKADLPIYVVRSDYSKKSYAKNINKLVKTHGFHKLSVVLNGLDNFASYGYGYGYGYEYYTDDHPDKALDSSWLRSLLGKR
jgi:tyrosine-protein kinase Etk/Wzc